MAESEVFVYYSFITESVSSHDLLIKAAQIHTGLQTRELEVYRERSRKPYFIHHPKLCFSVSHSGSCWLCAFGNKQIGADIQLFGSTARYTQLADRFFHPEESLAIKETQDPQQTFYRIWSRKEAAVKMLGIGIDKNFSTFSVLGTNTELLGHRIYIHDIHLPLECLYCSSIAYMDSFKTKVILF